MLCGLRRGAYGCHMTPDKDDSDLYGGSLKMQADPVVINYLTLIQRAQHNHDHEAEASQKTSLIQYVTQYQEKPMFRPLPDWAKP